MVVIYYEPDKHPAGFIGFRVTTSINGQFLQRYFSTRAATEQSDADTLFLYRRLEAELQYLEWQRESLLHRYHQFVTESHPNTRPERGVGVHGLTAAFMHQGKSNWQACFPTMMGTLPAHQPRHSLSPSRSPRSGVML